MIIPFGKYKNQEIDILAEDLSYARWMLEQAWFATKYPDLANAIEVLVQEESKEASEKALNAKQNMLLSIDLKREKIAHYTQYPLSLPVIKNLERTLLHPHVTYIIGENGSGKSTLLEALAITQGFNPEGGTINFNFSTHDTHSNLHEYLRIAKSGKTPQTGFFLRAESFYNVATEIENLGMSQAYGDKPLHEQSHGEAFLSLMQHRFGDNGLYILDEPEAALSPNRQMSILTLMHELIKRGSQFIISTHSPILLAYPNSTIYEIGKEGLYEISYEESKTFQVSKNFLDDREKMLDILLS
jgi:predicted ATPase